MAYHDAKRKGVSARKTAQAFPFHRACGINPNVTSGPCKQKDHVMKTFGYMRFSYAGRSDSFLSKSDISPDAYLRQLYDPVRMEARFQLFEQLCLPSLRAQTDPDFRLFILTSESLPERYRARLEQAVSDMPQIRILTSDAPHIAAPFTEALHQEADPERDWGLHFRLDDDDALGMRVIKKLKQYAARARELTILTAPTGLYLTDLGGPPEVMGKFNPFVAIGYALACPPGEYRNPYDLAHYAFSSRADGMTIPRIGGYIHCAHAFSDTRFGQRYDYMNAQISFLARDRSKRAKHVDRLLEADFPWTTAEGLCSLLRDLPRPEIDPARQGRIRSGGNGG